MSSILDTKHTDLPWPLSLIPRRWTAIPSERKPFGACFHYFAAKKSFSGHFEFFDDSNAANYDIPTPDEAILAFSRYGFMFSFQTAGKWLFRIGTFRYDYVDKYYELATLTLKRQK